MPTGLAEVKNPGGLIVRKLNGTEISLKEFLATIKEGDRFLLFWKNFGENEKRRMRLSFFKFDRYDTDKQCLIGELSKSLRLPGNPIHDEIFLNELEQIQSKIT